MKLYKFRSFRDLDHLLDILVNRRLYCAQPSTLNDPFEGVYVSAFYPPRNTLNTSMQIEHHEDQSVTRRPASVWEPGLPGEHIRVCSLSASMKDILLWSAYADGLRGVAIEVEIPAEVLHPVTYVTSLHEHPVHLFDPRPKIEKILTMKTYHWKHEEEHRLLQAEPYFELGEAPMRVFLGTRISAANSDLLEKLRLPGVEIVPTLLDEEALEVTSAKLADQLGA